MADNEIDEVVGNSRHLLHQLDQSRAEIERLRARVSWLERELEAESEALFYARKGD